jgi:DNA-binding MarR family transcriptional regulator
MMSEVPIPLTGYRAVFAGMVLIIFGFIALYKGYKLPLKEAQDIIHGRNRGITESEIIGEMQVDRTTARRIIEALLQKGFLRRSTDKENISEEVFDAAR